MRSGRAYVAAYFSGSLEWVDFEKPKAETGNITLGEQPAETDARHSERLFYDASVSFRGWQSCSTCHVDGRSDGLNWDLTNDGVGTYKKTPRAYCFPMRLLR